MNITDPIRRQAQLTPEAPAVIRHDDTHVSYAQFDRTIDFLAARIQTLGLVPGSIAAVIAGRPYRQLCSMLALARLGIGGVSLVKPADDLDEHVGAWIADKEIAAVGGRKFVPLDGLWPEGTLPAGDVPAVPSCEDGSVVCFLLPTSGTTGVRRFVAVTHGMLGQRMATRAPGSATNEEVRQICTIGSGTGYGLMLRLGVLWRGGTVVMTAGPDQILAAIERHRVTHLAMAPVSLQRLVAQLPARDAPLPTLRQIEVGGAHLPKRLHALARQRLCSNIISQYGTTETGPVAAAAMTALQDEPGAVGHVYPGVEVQAVDAEGVALAPGSEGNLRIRAPGMAAAYLGSPEASAGYFKDGWFYSGDTGKVTAEGLLVVGGRTSEVINQGGRKVSPHLIEEVVLAVAGVREAAAFGVPDDSGVTRAWVAIVPEGAVDMAALRAACRERLKVGARLSVLKVPALPRNDAGKVLRNELRRMATAARAKRRAAATSA
jgi:acyl-CoA synthetase (AMP-forming)/AMP-acid ligase II